MQSAETTSPYPGPRPFTAAERDRFFGRARETRDVASLVIAQPLTVLHGATGVGKTSLLHAGVVPELERAGFEVLPVARVGGLLPPGTDPARLRNVFTFSVLMHWTQGQDIDPDALSRHTLASFLRGVAAPTAGGRAVPLAVVLDQVEELFVAFPTHWEQREGFIRELAECLWDDRGTAPEVRPLRFLLSIRDAHLADLERYAPLLPDVMRVRYHLDGLRVPAAAEAIAGPARHLFQKTDAEQVARGLAQRRVRLPGGKLSLVPSEFVEPMHIQLACEERFRRGGRAGPLNKPLDPDEALARFYDAAVARARSGWGSERKIRRWLADTMLTPEGVRVAAIRGKRTTAGLANKLVDNLEQERLLRGEERLGSQWVEIGHDRLIAPIQRSNEQWFERRRRNRRAWRFVLYMLLFAAAVSGLAYVGKLGWRQWEELQGEKAALEEGRTALEGDKGSLEERLALAAGELAGERLRGRLARLDVELKALEDDVLALQSLVVDMGRYRPSAREVEYEAETLTNFAASGAELAALGARVDAALAAIKALGGEVEAARTAHPQKELKEVFSGLAETLESREPQVTRLQPIVASLKTDHVRYSQRLVANLEGWEAPPRPGAPLSARMREQSRGLWREGFRALLTANPDTARGRFQRAIDRDPSNPAPYEMLGRLSWSAGEVEPAVESWRAALKNQKNYSPALASMGLAYLHKSSLADAERCLRGALALQPDYGPARLGLSAVEQRRAQLEDPSDAGKVARDNPCPAKVVVEEPAEGAPAP